MEHGGTPADKKNGYARSPFSRISKFGSSEYQHLQCEKKDGHNILQDFSYDYDIFANLAVRKDNLRNLEETFTYDHLNRLTDVWLNGIHTGHMTYDPLGRMTDKRTDGQNVFSAAQHDYVGPDGQLRPHAVSSAQTGDGFPQAGIQSIDYTMFDKVSTMTYNGSNHYVFEYGYDHQRTRMTATNGGILMVNKDYVGNCEFVRHAASPQLSFTYLSGPMGVFAMVEKEGATEQVQYILKDHLGSYTAITDDNGELVLQQSFDAWGNRRNPSTWTGNAAALNFHDRGFTGHEHLFGMVGGIYKEICLINMNGRMYDPIMSSFLSVDNYVQAPDFSQSFNRYAYCLNNPLRYVDPDGENPVVVAAVLLYLVFTETGYEIQKQISPVAFHVDIHLSGEQKGLGFDVSVGIPKCYPVSYRAHYGATYYWKYYDNSYQGWEQRYGGEWTFFSVLNYSGTTFKNGGEIDQTTNTITIGGPFFNVKYENDYMFDLGQYFPGVPSADNGDRYRTAAARIKAGPLSVGVNLFTGDPGREGGENGIRKTFEDPEFGGRETYMLNELGNDPDKYRAGVFYVGIGPFRFGKNSEQIRHTYQNRFAHDFLMKGDSPYFKVLDIKPKWYYYFGSGTGNTLW